MRLLDPRIAESDLRSIAAKVPKRGGFPMHHYNRFSTSSAVTHLRSIRVVGLVVAALLVATTFSPSATAAKKTTKAAKATAAKSSSKGAAARKKSAKKAQVSLGSLRRSKIARDRARANRAAAIKKVSGAKVVRQREAAELASLTSKVRVTGVSLDKARRSQRLAVADAAQARAELATLTARLTVLETGQRDAGLVAFTTGLVDRADMFIASETASEVGRANELGSIARRRSADIIDELGAIQEDLAIQRSRADRAEKKAREYRAAVASRLTDYQSARSEQSRVADAAEDQLEAKLAEAQSLAVLDKQTSARYAAESLELARAVQRAGVGGRGGGKYSKGSVAFPINDVIVQGSTAGTHGIRVAASLQQPLANLLAAALRDGIYLSGGGWRSSSQQIVLRRAHCGGSYEAIYLARASACRPPTARPGSSQHERGLAVDFTQNGSTLTRGSSGYRWMKANAWKYGFKNLPSEAWHWSTTGR